MGKCESEGGKKGYSSLRFFLANTRSAKGKSVEITTMTKDFDIICLTETHLDKNIESKTIIDTPNIDFFRRDRTNRGGGVLIAVKNIYQATQLNINTKDQELVIIKIPPSLIVCCCYRPHMSSPDLEDIAAVFSSIHRQYPNDNILFTGDMNLPYINWETHKVNLGSPYRNHHQQLLDILLEHNMTQVITEPTHIMGNTLDLICTNNIDILKSTQITTPGLSDHSILTAELTIPAAISSAHHKLKKVRDIRIHKKADAKVFEQTVGNLANELSEMTDVEDMWNKFS